ncbi:MAG: hypothetical protein ACO32I_07675 [Candidatus Limnocylindrus sp.]
MEDPPGWLYLFTTRLRESPVEVVADTGLHGVFLTETYDKSGRALISVTMEADDAGVRILQDADT